MLKTTGTRCQGHRQCSFFPPLISHPWKHPVCLGRALIGRKARMALLTVSLLVLMLPGLYTGIEAYASYDLSSHRRRCYSGLFMSREELADTAARNSSVFFNRMFSLTSYSKKAVFTETCGDFERVASPAAGVNVLKCAAPNSTSLSEQGQSKPLPKGKTKRAVLTECAACCQTEMSISVPLAVTDLYSDDVYQARHFFDSYQIVNLGHCASPGGACGFQGTCTQAYRIHWMLVATPMGDTFVPTEVPSHCTCIYS